MAISYGELGDIYSAQGNLTQALAFYEKDFDIFESLSRLEPSNVDFSRHLAISYCKLGNIYSVQRNLDNARLYLVKGQELLSQLCEAFSDYSVFRSDLQEVKRLLKALDLNLS